VSVVSDVSVVRTNVGPRHDGAFRPTDVGALVDGLDEVAGGDFSVAEDISA